MSKKTTRKNSEQTLREEALENLKKSQEHQRKAILYAKDAGDALNALKLLVGHGDWGAWVENNLPISQRAASDYMRVSNEWEQLQFAVNGTTPLSIKQAIKVLQGKVPIDESKNQKDDENDNEEQIERKFLIRKLTQECRYILNELETDQLTYLFSEGTWELQDHLEGILQIRRALPKSKED